MSIIEKICEHPEQITEDDISSWILPEVIEYFDSKYSSLANYAYGYNNSNVGKRAIKEEATSALQSGLFSYLFKSQLWRTGRKLEPYLITCLNRRAEHLRGSLNASKKTCVPICPCCKSLNEREYLSYEYKKFRCQNCTNLQDRIQDRIKTCSTKEKGMLEYELRLRKMFALHSRIGFRCPDCSRFIPKSTIYGKRVSCPYDLDCSWFGYLEELEQMQHPVGLGSDRSISLNSPIGAEHEVQKQDLVRADYVSPDLKIEATQKYQQEIKILEEVIDIQKSKYKSEPQYKVIKKILMYEAFQSMIEKCPEEMVSYLVHQNHGGELPIQARIFQEFISIVENSLPLEIYYNGGQHEIYSLQDPRLDLFTGMSEFKAHVRQDGSVPNLTKEIYIGGRKGRDRGPCFIGQLIDVRAAQNDQSIIEHVDFYTFSQIKMKSEVPVGLEVIVKHLRIPSHYEMMSLVILQRSRRKIVDSVYQRINKTKRIPGL